MKKNNLPSFEETEEVSTTSLPSFDETEEIKPTGKQYSLEDTAIAHGKQGATLGLSDEVDAATKALAKHSPLPESTKDWKGLNAIAGGAKALYDVATGPKTLEELGAEVRDDYVTNRDKERSDLQAMQEQNPKTALGSRLAGNIATGGVASLGAKSIPAIIATETALGGIQGAGESTADSPEGVLKDAGISAGISGGLSSAGSALVKSKIMQKFGNALKKGAGKLAENATGATGATVFNKFKDGAGEELLDRGMVKAFDNPASIAKRTGKALDDSGKAIGSILEQLDNQGVTASRENVMNALEQQIKAIQKVDGNPGQLQTILDRMKTNTELGSSVPISQMEGIKKEFGKGINNWVDPEKGFANKEGYSAARREVERAATESNPQLAKQFKTEKETYGLLAPVQEASEKRAAQQAQSPFGGLQDIVTSGVTGGILGGASSQSPEGALAGAAGGALLRRQIAPRISSTAAVGLNNISKIITKTPEKLGKWAPVLQNALQKGGNSLGVTSYILQNQDPEYREHLRKLQEEGSDE